MNRFEEGNIKGGKGTRFDGCTIETFTDKKNKRKKFPLGEDREADFSSFERARDVWHLRGENGLRYEFWKTQSPQLFILKISALTDWPASAGPSTYGRARVYVSPLLLSPPLLHIYRRILWISAIFEIQTRPTDDHRSSIFHETNFIRRVFQCKRKQREREDGKFVYKRDAADLDFAKIAKLFQRKREEASTLFVLFITLRLSRRSSVANRLRRRRRRQRRHIEESRQWRRVYTVSR